MNKQQPKRNWRKKFDTRTAALAECLEDLVAHCGDKDFSHAMLRARGMLDTAYDKRNKWL